MNNKEYRYSQVKEAFKCVEYNVCNNIFEYMSISEYNSFHGYNKREYVSNKPKKNKCTPIYMVDSGVGLEVDKMLCKRIVYDKFGDVDVVEFKDILYDRLDILSSIQESIDKYAVLLTLEDVKDLLGKDNIKRVMYPMYLEHIFWLFVNGLTVIMAGNIFDYALFQMSEEALKEYNESRFYIMDDGYEFDVVDFLYRHNVNPNMHYIIGLSYSVSSCYDLKNRWKYSKHMSNIFEDVCKKLNITFDNEVFDNLFNKYGWDYDSIKNDFISYIVDVKNYTLNPVNYNDSEVEFKKYTKLDVLKGKIIDEYLLIDLLKCPEDMLKKWVKNGMLVEGSFKAVCTKDNRNTFLIENVSKWLSENNKTKYMNLLNKRLNKPYKCQNCVCRLGKDQQNANDAIIKYENKRIMTPRYLCQECYDSIKYNVGDLYKDVVI